MVRMRYVAVAVVAAGALARLAATRVQVSVHLRPDRPGASTDAQLAPPPHAERSLRVDDHRAPRHTTVSARTIRAAGVGIVGLATWLGLLLDQLLTLDVIGPLTAVTVIAVGWIVPASHVVVSVRRDGASGRFRTLLPSVTTFGIVVMLHVLGFGSPLFRDNAALWVWSCFAAIAAWSLFFYCYRQGPRPLGIAFAWIDVVGFLIATRLIWPQIGGITTVLSSDEALTTKTAVVLLALAGVAATLPLTSSLGSRQSLLYRLAWLVAGSVLYLVAQRAFIGEWSDLLTGESGSDGAFLIASGLAFWALGAWDRRRDQVFSLTRRPPVLRRPRPVGARG